MIQNKKKPKKKFIINSVSSKNYLALKDLALKHTLLNLPADDKLLKSKIKMSESSFAKKVPAKKQNFLFILREITNNKDLKKSIILGTSQISAKVGTSNKPFYSLQLNKKENYLQLRTITDGPSYLGGLIVRKEYRGHPEKIGKQLSLIRFLWAAIKPNSFESTLHAEVAPFSNKEGKYPFFEDFIKKIIPLSMEEIDYLTLVDKEKLFSFFPRKKFFLSSLPREVVEALGKPNSLSGRAAHLLKKQNFRFCGDVDPFDGGPYFQANTKEIPIIKNTLKVTLKIKKETNNSLENKNPLKNKTVLENKKWLWGQIKEHNFKGGVLEGEITKQNTLLVLKKELDIFSLKNKELIFITPFD